jgi:hypothetical protein
MKKKTATNAVNNQHARLCSSHTGAFSISRKMKGLHNAANKPENGRVIQ